MVLLIGIPASGKSTFCKQMLYQSHIRINRDMLKTKHREDLMIDACMKAKQGFVIDNTNITRDVRKRHIEAAREHGFRVTGYYFQSKVEDCLARNEMRPTKQQVPTKAILSKHSQLELPSHDEGYDELHYVIAESDGNFAVQDWENEV